MMSCLLFFNFILLLHSITLLILGVTTSRWLVFNDDTSNSLLNERSIGIISSCQRLYRQGTTDQYSTINNFTTTGSTNSIYDDAYVCYNRLLKWHHTSINGPELLGKQDIIIYYQLMYVYIIEISLNISTRLYALKFNSLFYLSILNSLSQIR